MKFIILILALVFASVNVEATRPVETTPAEFGQFVLGFVEGLEISMNANATQCIQQAGATFDDFSNGFTLISIGFKKKSISNVQQGLVDIGLGLQEIPQVLTLCKVEQFVAEIESLAKELSSGTAGIIEVILKEALNIFHNRVDLTTDFKTAISAWKSGDYTTSGKNVGEIVGVLLSA
eukprot:gene5135-6395_t